MSKDTSKKKGTVSAVLPKKITPDFLAPQIEPVLVKLEALKPEFWPVSIPLSPNVKAKAFVEGANINLPHRGTACISLGLKVEVSPGYRIYAEPNVALANRGLIINTTTVNDGVLSIVVTNIGKEIIAICNEMDICQLGVQTAFPMVFVN